MASTPLGRTPLAFGQAVRIAAVLGLWVGLARAAGLALSVVALRRLVEHGVHLAWMAPLAALAESVILALLVWGLGRYIPVLRTPAGFVIPVLLVLATGLVGNVQGLHLSAVFVLGAGIAVAAGRIVNRWPQAALSATRWLFAAGAVILVAVVAGVVFWVRAGQFPAGSPATSPGGTRPNVVLIVLDTVRARSLGLYGNSRATSPNLDRFASTGARFDHAFAAAPWTTPSHASMMTGRWPIHLDVNWHQGLSGNYRTVAQVLRESGYTTAGFSANGRNAGASSGIARGFSHFEDYGATAWNFARSSSLGERVVGAPSFFNWFGFRSPPERQRSPDVTRAFLEWLPEDPGRPFFAFLNYFDAHDPYEAPLDIERQFDVPQGEERPHGKQLERANWSTKQADALLRAYEAAIAFQDRNVGHLIEELQARGLLANTLVLITSDHGEEFLEHGLMWHGHSLYGAAVHVPLVAVFPGRIRPGTVVQTPVSLRSIATTIARAAGDTTPSQFPGVELIEVANGGAGEPVLIHVDGIPQKPDAFPVHHGPLFSLVDAGHRYIIDGRGREMLYRLEDITEREELKSESASDALLQQFRTLLATMKQGNLQ